MLNQHKKMGGGNIMLRLFSILISMFLIPSAFALQDHYVDVENGAGSTCTISSPCSLTQAISNAGSGETIHLRVRRANYILDIDGDYGPLTTGVTFAAYTGDATATSATFAFAGTFELGASGKFLPHSMVKADFEHLVIADGNTYPFGETSAASFPITISNLEAGFVTIHRLDVKSDLVIKRLETATSSPVIAVEELEVSKGATLTVGMIKNTDGTDRANPAHLRVPLRQAATANDKFDNLVVDGIIDGAGSVLILHDNSSTGRGASDFNLHLTADYTPTGDKRVVDHMDCVTIEGDGEIQADLYAVAAGNICVTLKKIGRLIVTGSIQDDAYTTEMITTDVIFREDVEITGNVEQWNDAKIKFEKTSTIDGSVILDSGAFSYPVLTAASAGSNPVTVGIPRDNFDATATSGGDLIVRSASRNNDESCWPTRRATGRTIEDGVIPGVRFEGPTTIADDLDLRHVFDNRDHEGTGLTDTGAAQRCLIAVDFWVLTPGFSTRVTEGQALTSRISGDILAQNGGSINLFGGSKIQLAPDFSSSSTFYFNHHLELDGDIFADGQYGLSIWEGNSTRYDAYSGSCASTDGVLEASTLTGSSQFVLTDEREHTIRLGDGNMRMFSLAIHERVQVQGGTLMTKGIHVRDGGELISNETVQVGWSDPSLQYTYWAASRFRANPLARGRLILEGDGLDGRLHSDSYIVGLTYASARTDQVNVNEIRSAGRSNLHLVFNLDRNRYMRISDPLIVNNVGLCSGTVILEEPDENDSNSLTINDVLYVKDGVFEFDTNRSGSLATDDKNEDANQVSYILWYETEGARTIGNEWFGTPRELVIDHDQAVITSDVSRKLPGRLRVMAGEFDVNGTLTIGTDFKIRDTWRRITVDEDAVLQADTIRAHERMIVNGTVKTGGGDIYSLGSTDDDGRYVSYSSTVSIRGKEGKIDLGEGGTLHLGPPLTEKQDGLITPSQTDGTFNDDLRDNLLYTQLIGHSEAKQPFKGNLNVTAGSKFNSINYISYIDTLTFDGTATPNLTPVSDSNKRNYEGILFFQNHRVPDQGAVTLVDSVRIDSLSAKNGWIRFWNTPLLKITKNIDLESAILTLQSQVHLEGDLTIRETGALSFDGNAASYHPDADRFLVIHGDFHVGAGKLRTEENTYYQGPQNPPSPGLSWALGASVPKTVMGDYRVDSDALQHRMLGSTVKVHGDFHLAWESEFHESLDADLEFVGKEKQEVSTGAMDLGDVTINGAGIMLTTDVSQAPSATLTLKKGTIGGDFSWVVTNTKIEENLAGRMAARDGDMTCGTSNDQRCSASILGGSRQSHVSAVMARHIEQGGTDRGGYLFPLGVTEDVITYYRPAILQLPDAITETQKVEVSLTQIPEGATPDWEGLQVQQSSGNSLLLDVYSDIFWKVDLGEEELSSDNLSLRVAAAGLSNVNDPEGLRIVQWDCDWQRPRLAGQYETAEEGTFAVNGYIGGVINLTQVFVDVGRCSIFGIAANQAENPIHIDRSAGGIARVQFIHNAQLPAVVNVSLDGRRFASGLDFQSATRYRAVAAGDKTVSIEFDGGADEAIEIPLGALTDDEQYAVIAHGTLSNFGTKILNTNRKSVAPTMVDVLLVHGSADLGDVDLQTIDGFADPRTANPTRLLARGFGFDDASPYKQFDAGYHRIEVVSGRDKIGVFDVDLNDRQGETLILNLSGSKAMLDLYGVDMNGDRVNVTVVTGTESEIAELPTDFALHGNYPNPFNPSTRIQFDLPESAQVTVEIVDMLGREVMALPVRDFEAGANRSIDLNATSLASGTYMYRVIANGAEGRYVKTGRMMLVK